MAPNFHFDRIKSMEKGRNTFSYKFIGISWTFDFRWFHSEHYCLLLFLLWWDFLFSYGYGLDQLNAHQIYISFDKSTYLMSVAKYIIIYLKWWCLWQFMTHHLLRSRGLIAINNSIRLLSTLSTMFDSMQRINLIAQIITFNAIKLIVFPSNEINNSHQFIFHRIFPVHFCSAKPKQKKKLNSKNNSIKRSWINDASISSIM